MEWGIDKKVDLCYDDYARRLQCLLFLTYEQQILWLSFCVLRGCTACWPKPERKEARNRTTGDPAIMRRPRPAGHRKRGGKRYEEKRDGKENRGVHQSL